MLAVVIVCSGDIAIVIALISATITRLTQGMSITHVSDMTVHASTLLGVRVIQWRGITSQI